MAKSQLIDSQILLTGALLSQLRPDHLNTQTGFAIYRSVVITGSELTVRSQQTHMCVACFYIFKIVILFAQSYYGYHISRRTSWTDCNIRIPIVMYHAYVKPLCITNNGTYKCTGWTRRIAVPGYDRNQKRIARYCHPYADKGYMVICHINGTRVCRVMPCIYSFDGFTCQPQHIRVSCTSQRS